MKKACLLGCYNPSTGAAKVYSAANTSNIKSHLIYNHKTVWEDWLLCKNGEKNYNEVIQLALEEGASLLAQRKKSAATLDRFLTKASKVPTQVCIDLSFVLWAVVRGVSRESLNDPLLDLALKRAGVNVLPNR